MIFAYLFICDDYYTSCQALSDAPEIQSWRSSARFWIDICILIFFYGFFLSNFRSPLLLYILIITYFLGSVWCNLLRQDHLVSQPAPNKMQLTFIRHLERQQRVMCFATINFVGATLVNNLILIFKSDGTVWSFDRSQMSLNDMKIVPSDNLIYLLIALLFAQWILRFIVATNNHHLNLKIVRICSVPFRSSKAQKIGKKFREFIYPKRLLLFVICAICLGFVTEELRIVAILVLVLCWFLWEIVAADGLYYDYLLASRIQQETIGNKDQQKEIMSYVDSIGQEANEK